MLLPGPVREVKKLLQEFFLNLSTHLCMDQIKKPFKDGY